MCTGRAAGIWAVDLFSTTYFDEIIIFELSKDQTFRIRCTLMNPEQILILVTHLLTRANIQAIHLMLLNLAEIVKSCNRHFRIKFLYIFRKRIFMLVGMNFGLIIFCSAVVIICKMTKILKEAVEKTVQQIFKNILWVKRIPVETADKVISNLIYIRNI